MSEDKQRGSRPLLYFLRLDIAFNTARGACGPLWIFCFFGPLAASDNLLELLLNRLQVGYDDNGSWEEGEGSKTVGEIHSGIFCIILYCPWENLTCDINSSTEYKEEGELGHCLSVLSVLSDSVLLNVAEADNGHSNADSHRYKASKKAPIGKESVTSLNEESTIVIGETGHTMDKVSFKHMRYQHIEAYGTGSNPEDGEDDCSTAPAD